MSVDSRNNTQELQRKDAQIVALQSQLSSALQELSWAALKIQPLEERLRQGAHRALRAA